MAAKSKGSSRPKTISPDEPNSGSPPLTLEEHVHRIEAIGKRIERYVQFMCQLASATGMSAEVKEKAVFAFYKEIIRVEKQLGQIHDELRLE